MRVIQSWRNIFFMLALVSTAAACTTSGVPTPATPSTPGPQRAIPIEVPATGPWAFTYDTGTHRFRLTQAAIIEAIDTNTTDSIRTGAVLSYRIVRDDLGLLVAGQIDSFSISTSGSIPIAERGAQTPLLFSARIDSMGHMVDFVSADTTTCGSATGPLLSMARDVFVPIPPSIDIGSTWSDTTESTTCRGDVAITTTAVRRYEVRGWTPTSASPLIAIVRTSQITVHGSGTHPLQAAMVSGQGTATADLDIDPALGRVVGGRGFSTVEVLFDAASRRARFRQRVQQTIDRIR